MARRKIILRLNDKAMLEKVWQLIADDPGRDHQINQLCAQYALTPYRLRLGFIQLFGCSFYQHRRVCRMQRARELLINTSKTVKMVAAECGYRSVANFTTAFRKYHGISPARVQPRY
jgi:AraC-like DNA-binding protein